MSTETIKDVFLVEARDQLDALETTLLSLERDPQDEATIHTAFRAAHTIKGSSAMADATAITAFTHNVENVLDRMREGALAVEPDLVSLLLACADHIGLLLGLFREDTPLDAETRLQGEHLLERLMPWLEEVSEGKTSPQASAVAGGEHAGRLACGHWHISIRLGPEIFQRGVEPVGLIRYLATLGELLRVQTVHSRLPAVAEMDPELCYLDFEIDFRGDVSRATIEQAFAFLDSDSEVLILEPNAAMQDVVRTAQGLAYDPSRWLHRLADAQTLSADEHAILRNLLANANVAQSATGHKSQHQVASEHTEVPSAQGARQSGKPVAAQPQLRVDADKLDRLVDLVGELVIAGAAASVMASRVGREELTESLSVVSRLIEDMREAAMQMRMVQISGTFNRFQRVVRDVSIELDKDIELKTHGGDTELDKSVVEKIGDPLMHLVRNSMDHGIESAEVRQAAGKPAKGCVTLSAQHEAGSILIEVRDDGAGLSTQKILAKAIERKLVSPSQTLTEAEIHQLIFEPGFSTAERVTELSGRGVGMDVVRRNIQALRGSVAVESRPGQGCSFLIRLPLTLAIIDGFRVGIGDAHFVIPLDMVAECIKHDGQNRSCDYLSLRGEMLPFVRLRELFGSEAPETDVAENVVVVRHAGQQVGIVVEKLYGEMQAVIKPLGVMFQGIKGLAGSTLLGGGEIAVILDIPRLIEGASRASV